MLTIKFLKKTISYTDEGSGKTIVLLHGFTESSKIWTSFATQLSKRYRVITVDLPGHGKSGRVGSVHTMEMMADVVRAVLKKAAVGKCLMIGHSMGGYVTLAFAGKYPKLLKGFGLFHSHCFADTKEDTAIRNRTISIVEKDKFSFVAQFIPGLFPPDVQKKFAKEIERLVQRASKMDKESVIAALEGMKNRVDQTELLKATELPVLFILGLQDSKAPVPKLWSMIRMPAISQTLLLRDCGHMGYLEAPEECLGAIQGFAKSYL